MTEHEFRAKAEEVIPAMLVENSKGKLTADRVKVMLVNMIIHHGENAVNDMYGWVLWAQKEGYDNTHIMVSLYHDLAGRDDKFMQPRTVDYMETYLAEINKDEVPTFTNGDNDQPTTCPDCGGRTEFKQIDETLQWHTCISCGFIFNLEFKKEK